jgi:hypothetical protein
MFVNYNAQMTRRASPDGLALPDIGAGSITMQDTGALLAGGGRPDTDM